MRSIFPGASAGNVNLRGKKTKNLSCNCCDLRNFKDEELLREHNKEIKYYLGNHIAAIMSDSDSEHLGSIPSSPANLKEINYESLL